jgi:hypothetical protein
MSSESVCQAARSWVEVGSFHTRLFGVVYVTCGDFDMIYIFNRSWVDTRGQQYITHLHTNSTHNTEIGKLESAGRAPSCELYPGICLTTEEKARKNLS